LATVAPGALRRGDRAVTVVIARRDSRAALWAGRLVRFAAVLLVMAGLSHRYGLLETVPFFVILGLGGLMAVLGFGLACAGLVDLWENGSRGGRRSIASAAVALLLLAPYAHGAWRMTEHPGLVDVATDVMEPPQFRSLAVLRPPMANRVAAIDAVMARQIVVSYPDLTGRRYAVAADRTLDAVLALVAERGWTVVARRGVPGQDGEMAVEVRAFSRWLRFPADVSLRLTDEGDMTFVDMRSASHYARHDLGENARLIERFLEDLDGAMASVAEPAT
jgi:uncharacterized protein (DUF1499 family)